jgi:hypothetical protein
LKNEKLKIGCKIYGSDKPIFVMQKNVDLFCQPSFSLSLSQKEQTVNWTDENASCKAEQKISKK